LNTTPVIIINWNGIKDTLECIESVLSLKKVDYHIHLIDNNSDNDEGEQLKECYHSNQRITCHLYSKNYGFTKAHIKIWEEILTHQSCEYIALLNNDTVVDENWLFELIKSAKQNDAQVISSKMINYYNRSIMDNAGHFMLNTGEIMPIGHGKPIEKYKHYLENVGACAGACLYKTNMIKEIGFFDPYFSTGYEDAEYGLRATILNYKCIYSPESIVFHKMGQSIKKIFDKSYATMIQTSILYTYFKLIPKEKIILDSPSIIFKGISIIIIDIVLLRFDYLEIMAKSWIKTFKQKEIIINKRSETYENTPRQLIKIRSLISKTTFFLLFDIKRFLKLISSNRPSSLEQY